MTQVLIVEDDKGISKAIGMRLVATGYSVDTAFDAATAMMHARENTPDVVLMDISLPGGDGFVVAERLRLNPETSQVPIIFITASKEPGLKARARKLGAVAYLEKPFSASQLLEALQDCELKQAYC